jgi:pimeloyl-ACP methyl ester carboxylesterase
MDEESQGTITLADGRTLAYAFFGDPDGFPVFHFHGWPGSRLEPALVDDVARAHRLRVIGVDRPGMGRSTFKRRRRLYDWPADVVALADALGIRRFAVLGYSGGGPYAAATAHALPERVIAATIVAGAGPDISVGWRGWRRSMARLTRRIPALAFPTVLWLRTTFRLAPRFTMRLARRVAPAHVRRYLTPPVQEALATEVHEAFAQGLRGEYHDMKLYLRSWGFDLAEVRVPVRLWHGELDVIVPIDQGRQVAAAIPGCDARFVEASHLILVERAGDILSAIAEEARAAAR